MPLSHIYYRFSDDEVSLDYRPAMSMFGRSNGSKDEVNRKVENCAFEAQPQVIVEQGVGVQQPCERKGPCWRV
jgi:hypothetical protein